MPSSKNPEKHCKACGFVGTMRCMHGRACFAASRLGSKVRDNLLVLQLLWIELPRFLLFSSDD